MRTRKTCAICFYLEMHKLQRCKDDYITAFLVSCRSSGLLAGDTRQIFGRSAKLPATKAKSLYSRIAHHRFKNSRKIWLPISPNEKNRLIYSRMRCVVAKDCGRNRTAHNSKTVVTKKGRLTALNAF